MFYGNYGTKFPKSLNERFILNFFAIECRVVSRLAVTGRKSGESFHPSLISEGMIILTDINLR